MTIYFPDFSTQYLNPNLSMSERNDLKNNCKLNIEKAIKIISAADKETEAPKNRIFTDIKPNSSAYAFLSYFVSNCPQIMRSATPCLSRNHDKKEVTRPIPRSAYHVLADSRMDFEGNTCCLFVVTPPIIVAAGLLSGNPLVGVFVGICSNLLILQTAGINTYACSGDVGIVPDLQGRLLLQDGLRADAIPAMKKAYLDIATHLQEKLKAANTPEEHEQIKQTVLEIKNRWETTFQEIANCGLASHVVEEVLAPLSVVLFEIESFSKIQGEVMNRAI